MPLRFVWGVRPIDGGRHLDPGNKGELQLDPEFNIATTQSQQWLLQFCKDVQMQPFYRTLSIGQLSLSNCFMETFRDWMNRRCYDELAGIDHKKCCQVTKFPYPEPIFNECLMEAIGDLYETPTDFWRPGAAGPKFNITTNRVEAMVVEFDSNVMFSFSHTSIDSFYRDVEMWFAKKISTAPKELRCGFFISHLGFYDVQNSLTWDTIAAIGIALSATFTVLALATRNFSLTISAATTVCATIFVTVGVLILIFDWKLNILESVAITLSIGLSVDFSLHYAITYTNASSKKGNDVERSVIYAVVNMAAPVSMAALTTFLAGVCLLPTRVLAYIQIGTFIAILMSTSWVFSTFFFHALLRIIGRGSKCEHIPRHKNNTVYHGNDDDNIINHATNNNCKQLSLDANEGGKLDEHDEPAFSNNQHALDSQEQLFAVSENTVTHAVSIANGNRKSSRNELSNELRNELKMKIHQMPKQSNSIEYSNTIMITQEMLSNGGTHVDYDKVMRAQCSTSLSPREKHKSSNTQHTNQEAHNIEQISSLDYQVQMIERADFSTSKSSGTTPRRNISMNDNSNSRFSPVVIKQRKSNVQIHETPSREDRYYSNKIHQPVSATSSDALESSIASKNLDAR